VRRVRRGLPSVFLLALALAACGGSDDEGAVKDSVKTLYSGLADKDAGKICGVLSRKQRDAVARSGGTQGGGASCEQVMGVALSLVKGRELEDADRAEVTKVNVEGDKATATVTFKGKPGKLGLAKEAGDWKVSRFDPGRL
jgi:hypothetical protein